MVIIDGLVECNGYASLSSFLPECMFVRLPAIRLLVIKPKEERGNCSFPQNTALHTHTHEVSCTENFPSVQVLKKL